MQTITQAPPKNFDLLGFLRLIRFNNLFILAFTQYMIKIFLIDEEVNLLANLRDPYLFFLVLSTSLIAAAGYIINDYYDVKIDMVNKPEKVIVGRLLKRRIVMAANIIFNFFGLSLALFLKFEVFLFSLIAAFLLWLYSNHLKRFPLIGNAAIALLTAMSVLILLIYYPENQLLVSMFAMFAFFMSLIREIIKDMEDVEGDANFGCRTLPVVWGIRRTKRVIYVFFFTFALILLSTLISFPNEFALYLYAVVLPPLVWFFIKLIRADKKRDFSYLSNLCKIIMVLGILSMTLI